MIFHVKCLKYSKNITAIMINKVYKSLKIMQVFLVKSNGYLTVLLQITRNVCIAVERKKQLVAD